MKIKREELRVSFPIVFSKGAGGVETVAKKRPCDATDAIEADVGGVGSVAENAFARANRFKSLKMSFSCAIFLRKREEIAISTLSNFYN